jgi:carbonic anhydrase
MENISPDQALKKLLDGNDRFVNDKAIHPNQNEARRKEVLSGQNPFAAVLHCSDSRDPIELLFDQGIGDIFGIRVAGNIANDPAVLASIEYAAEHLKVPLILVLGHQDCGAVKATIAGGTPEGHIGFLTEIISAAVSNARNIEGDLLENSIRANIEMALAYLKNSEPILKKLVEEGKLKIVGAYYNLESGKVEVI